MQAIIERCCGLDVHQETVVACVLVGAPGAHPTKEVRTFRTVTRDLEALRDWLQELGVTHVGMESTGVYWRPVYAVLEGHFDLIVGNARHIRNVPGRKTDVKDSEWIADLVRHGLIAKSYVPPGRCGSCVSFCATAASGGEPGGRAQPAAEAPRDRQHQAGERRFRRLRRVRPRDAPGADRGRDLGRSDSRSRQGPVRRKRADLILALDGRLEEHHRFLLAMQLHRLEAIEVDIAALDLRIDERLEPYRAPHTLLMQIPGVDSVVAASADRRDRRRHERVRERLSSGGLGGRLPR